MATFRDQASLISGFLTSQPQPSCIIAHNGHQFDFPILQAELRNANHALPSDAEIWCADSLEAFRVLDGLPAVPEWLREKRILEKRRAASVSSLTPKVQSGNKTEVEKNSISESEGTVSQSASKEAGGSSADSVELPAKKSPPKRQADATNASAASCKHPKTDPATDDFDTQMSTTDSQLVEASDAPLVQESADAAVAVSTEQSYLETTPRMSPGRSSDDAGVADQFVKRHQPAPVNSSERDRVARRLFDTQPSRPAEVSPPSAEHLNAASEVPAAKEGDGKWELFPQGSLSDEDIVQLAQKTEAVTSLASPVAGTGDCIEPFSLPPAQEKTENVKNKTSDENNTYAIDHTPTKLCSKLRQNSNAMVSVHSLQTTQIQSPSSSSACGLCSTSSAQIVSDSKPRVSYSLSKIYEREFGCCADASHSAEDDCVSLLKLIVKKSSEFMSFVEGHAVAFDSVAPNLWMLGGPDLHDFYVNEMKGNWFSYSYCVSIISVASHAFGVQAVNNGNIFS